jgi:phage repressor protein C with HTH and peptisase S24 domain
VRDRVIDRHARPASLADDFQAYGLTMIGDSMWPRFRPGRRVAASPAAPVRIGDDVLVLLAGDGKAGQQALLKELVRRTGALLELRQFNPDLTFTVPADAVQAVHKIVGELV